MLANEIDRAIDMAARLGMKADDIGARLRKIGDDAIDRAHHEVHIDRHLHVRTDRRADERPDGQVGHVMIVHHVEMDDIGARGDDIANLLAQTREVRRKNARGDTKLQCAHADPTRGRNRHFTLGAVPIERPPTGPTHECLSPWPISGGIGFHAADRMESYKLTQCMS